MSNYQDALNKRKAQQATKADGSSSFKEWATEGIGFLKRGMNVALDKVNDKLEEVAPSDPEARVQKEIVNKVVRDELIEKFSTAGRAFGGKIATAGGTAGAAAISFLKGATGAVSNEAKARLEQIDKNSVE